MLKFPALHLLDGKAGDKHQRGEKDLSRLFLLDQVKQDRNGLRMKIQHPDALVAITGAPQQRY